MWMNSIVKSESGGSFYSGPWFLTAVNYLYLKTFLLALGPIAASPFHQPTAFISSGLSSHPATGSIFFFFFFLIKFMFQFSSALSNRWDFSEIPTRSSWYKAKCSVADPQFCVNFYIPGCVYVYTCILYICVYADPRLAFDFQNGWICSVKCSSTTIRNWNWYKEKIRDFSPTWCYWGPLN